MTSRHRVALLALVAAIAMLAPAGPARAQTGAPPPAVEPVSPANSYRPRTVIEIQVGREFGGGSASALAPGDGLLISAVGSLTPLWISDTVGLGFGIAVDWKENSAFSRVLGSAFGHAVLQLRDRWLTFVRAGTVKLASAEGVNVDSHWGAFVDWGVLRWFDHQFGVGLLVRYTNLTVTYQGADVDAASFGPAIAVFFGD